MNQQRFNASEFRENPVKSVREISYIKIPKNSPSNSFLSVRTNKVTTQDSFLSVGQNTISEEFFEINKIRTEEVTPLGRKTYSQMTFLIDYDIMVINRSIYSALDWLGDVGGLADALTILLEVGLSLFYAAQFRFHLVKIFFTKQIEGKVATRPSNKSQTVKEVIQGRKKIEGSFGSLLYQKFLCCATPVISSRLIRRGERYLDKQIDIVTVIKRQIRFEILLKSMVTPLQWKLAAHSKQFVLNDDSSTESSPSSGEDAE